ncbi:SDR family NAD(P)-dependent oxidoreductase [Crenobacter caeni]|uniref:SDR family NAD(P)-dependent oxidoreductase n=1 Tax=Crenobacter caeni TaxID=2705474 RepID=A0A6B2KQA3_9NEIS|nr:SDR family NAD(P)-dependent oxidoreductase [Crenobacter caeni]NDV12231.1 SDR family NAD(P)-dependent oxidoreductase [Crenobacter caeni]
MSANTPIRQWQGKHVWLVGAGHGIGEALAVKLAKLGARLTLSGRNADALQAVAARCGGQAHCEPFDATDDAAWQDVAARLDAQGGVDLVVLLAGDYRPLRAWEVTPEAARALTDVNLMAAFYLVAACAPIFRQRGKGGIALTGSVAGVGGMPKATVYGATKAAVNHLAQTLYLDLAPLGVGVWVINPGFVRTRLTAGNDFSMPALISPEEAADAIVAGFAQGAFDIHFPRRFTTVLKLAALLPRRAWFWLMHKTTGL